MELANSQMVAMLPAWMQKDEADIAFAAVVDRVAQEVAEKAPMLTVWDKLDQLPEELLDELAWALDITWWDSEAPIATKRELVKSSDYVHSKLGTVAAMEYVARAYLGDGDVLEWFEYGGAPHNFKIATGNLGALHENHLRLIDRMLQAKRHTSKLESILIYLTGDVPLSSGAGYRESDTLPLFSGRDRLWAFAGVSMTDTESFDVCMIPHQEIGCPAFGGQAHRISDHTAIVMLPVWRISPDVYGGTAINEHACVAIDMVPAGAGEGKERSEDGGVQ